MMRRRIRIVRLIRRRQFRYRRMHVWRLDVVAVIVLFAAGWFLLPTLCRVGGSSSSASSRKGKFSIVENPLIDSDKTALSPAVFAFTASGGFAYGVAAAQLSEIGGQIPLIPLTPTRACSISDFDRFQDGSQVKVRQIAPPAVPPPPVFTSATRSNAVPARGVSVHVSAPGIVPDGHFCSTVKHGADKGVRITVCFGADGRADSAVLFPHTLNAADAVRVERAAMRLAGPPNTSAWILLLKGD